MFFAISDTGDSLSAFCEVTFAPASISMRIIDTCMIPGRAASNVSDRCLPSQLPFNVTLLGRNVQRAVAMRIDLVDVRLALEEDGDGLRSIASRCNHQRRVALVVGVIHVALADQKAQHANIASGGRLEHRLRHGPPLLTATGYLDVITPGPVRIQGILHTYSTGGWRVCDPMSQLARPDTPCT